MLQRLSACRASYWVSRRQRVAISLLSSPAWLQARMNSSLSAVWWAGKHATAAPISRRRRRNGTPSSQHPLGAVSITWPPARHARWATWPMASRQNSFSPQNC